MQNFRMASVVIVMGLTLGTPSVWRVMGQGGEPDIDISPTSLDFGAVTVGQSKDLTLTVRNTGSTPLTVISISSSNPQFSAPSPLTPFKLVAGAQQMVTARFTPTATGMSSGTLTINSNDPDEATVTVAMTGAGAAVAVPDIDVTPISLDFGSVTVGQSKDLMLTVRNTGDATLTVNSLASNNLQFSIPSPSTPFTVAAGAQQMVTVRFTPSSIGTQSGMLTVSSNAPNRPSVTVSLAGNGLAQPPAPRIDSINPPNGSVGSPITISGANFNPVAANNIVRFGNTQANLTSASATQIVTTVPAGLPDGAASVTVSVDGQTSNVANFIVVSQPLINLSRTQGVTANASSSFSGFPADRIRDGDINTSWFSSDGDAANLGRSPFAEVVLPFDATVAQINIRGNRQFADGFDVFAGRIDIFDAQGRGLLMRDVELPGPTRDIELPLAAPVSGVRRVRFTSTRDESRTPGFSELEVLGTTSAPVNLSPLSGVVANASSIFDSRFPADRIRDGNLNTSWFSACGDSANQGRSPWAEVVLPFTATVVQINIRGNRESADGFDIFAGRIDIFDAQNRVLFTRDVDLPGPTRDLDLPLVAPVSGVRRARFTSTRDESCEPGFSELEVIGNFAGGSTTVPDIDVTPTSLDFGSVNVGQSTDRTLTVRNTGTASLMVNGITSSNSRFSLVSPAPPFMVAAGGQQIVTVRFSPSATGMQTGTLAIMSNAANSPTVNVSLAGNGVSPAAPDIDVMPTSLDFGSVPVGQNRALTLQIRNLGNADLNINNLTSNNPQFSVPILPSPFILPAGGGLILTVLFAPTSAGAKSGTLAIVSNDPDEPTVNVAMTGTGSGGVLTVSQTPGAAAFTSIQAAIDAAGAGATIEIIDSATYRGDLTIGADKTGLTLRARAGQTPTVQGLGNTIITINGAQNITIRGLRITGGTLNGLLTLGPVVGNLTIEDCQFQAIPNIAIGLTREDTATINGNTFENLGGAAIFLSGGASATIMDNAFSGGPMNGDFSDGIELIGASADIIGNMFIDIGRIAIGTFPQAGAEPTRTSAIRIINNLIIGSGSAVPSVGDGIQVISSANTINQFTIVNNTIADNARLGIGFSLAGQSQALLINTIVTGSNGTGDLGAYMGADANQAARITIRNCLIGRDPQFGSIGRNGNITGDPRFVNPGAGNYRLRTGSRVIDAGDNSAIQGFAMDLDGNPRIVDGDRNGTVVVDIGAYEFRP